MVATAERTQPQARPATPAAGVERRSASSVRQTVLSLQRTAGNAAVARAIGPRAIQRCGAGCGCSSCGHTDEELLDEKMGAGLLRAAVERRSA
jgi:hypothetical protein